MATPKFNGLTVTPKADGTLDITANVTPGSVSMPTSATFSLPAVLKLIEDLATDLPTIIADVTAVFAAPAPAPPVLTAPVVKP